MQFLYPEMIALMLLPSLLLLYLLGTNRSKLQEIFADSMLERLRSDTHSLSRNARNLLLFTALLFMILALARPVVEQGEVSAESKGFDFVVVLDISTSMSAEDVYPNRFDLAKRKARQFIAQNTGNRLAITVFSRHSFIVSPLTTDSETALYLLDNLDKNAISTGGTNLLSALESANRLLEHSKQKALLLLSDGGDATSFEQEIAYARQENLQLYAIGIGTEEGSPIKTDGGFLKDKQGNIAIVKRNDSIAQLAEESGGAYRVFTHSDEDVIALSAELQSKLKKQSFESKTFKDYAEYYHYPLGIGLLFLLLGLSSIPRKGVATLCLCAVFSDVPVQAGLLDFQILDKAEEAYAAGKYDEAAKQYESLRDSQPSPELLNNLGHSYYRAGEYEKALKTYRSMQTDDPGLKAQKLYHMGNAQMQLKHYSEAKKNYEQALSIEQNSDITHNLELAKKLEEMQQQNQQQDSKGEGGEQNQEGDSQQNPSQNTQNSSAQNSQGQQPQQPSQGGQNSSRSDDEGQAQGGAGSDGSSASSATGGDQQKQSEARSSSGGEGQAENSGQKKDQEGESGAVSAKPSGQPEEISDMEEKKWLKLLQDNEHPTYLYQVPESSPPPEAEESPW